MDHPENDKAYKGLQVNSGVVSQPCVNPYRQVRRRPRLTVNDYVEGILKGNVTVLGQAVTLVESTADAHQAIAQEVIEKCLPYTGNSRRIGITGVPGAGKSTLLRAVNRMHRITSGTLTVNGTDVSTLSGKALRQFRRGIGMVFQSFNLVTRTTVIKNVLSACVPDMPFWRVLLGAFRKEDKLKALESLDKVGILDKAYMRADQLSGGQQQRVALARTLTQSPHIILADEPVAALDPVTAKQVMQDFVHINQELGISILLNIHHVELALEYADRIIGIRAGKIVYDGPSAKVDQAVLDAIYGEQAGAEECV